MNRVGNYLKHVSSVGAILELAGKVEGFGRALIACTVVGFGEVLIFDASGSVAVFTDQRSVPHFALAKAIYKMNTQMVKNILKFDQKIRASHETPKKKKKS